MKRRTFEDEIWKIESDNEGVLFGRECGSFGCWQQKRDEKARTKRERQHWRVDFPSLELTLWLATRPLRLGTKHT